MEIKSHILRLQGKAELPQEVSIGSNYHISLEGGIVNFTASDNDACTANRVYTFKPVKLDLLDPLGKTLKLKDARSKSQLWRARCWGIWKEQNINMVFDEWYDALMSNMIHGAIEIIEMYMPKI